MLSWSKLGTRYGKVRKLKYYCNIFLSVNPIFVVICCPIKQPLQNCLSKYSFMLLFFKSTKWKHAYLLLPLKTRAVFAHAQTILLPVYWTQIGRQFQSLSIVFVRVVNTKLASLHSAPVIYGAHNMICSRPMRCRKTYMTWQIIITYSGQFHMSHDLGTVTIILDF